MNEWNYLIYKSNLNINTQFTRPEIPDSIFLLNSTTPQDGSKIIQEIDQHCKQLQLSALGG